jgi:hypothetical protein
MSSDISHFGNGGKVNVRDENSPSCRANLFMRFKLQTAVGQAHRCRQGNFRFLEQLGLRGCEKKGTLWSDVEAVESTETHTIFIRK